MHVTAGSPAGHKNFGENPQSDLPQWPDAYQPSMCSNNADYEYCLADMPESPGIEKDDADRPGNNDGRYNRYTAHPRAGDLPDIDCFL